METPGDSSESTVYDVRCLERTYNSVSPDLKRFVIGMVGSWDQADDILQTVFLAAVVRMRSSGDRRPFSLEQSEEERRRWLFGVATNKAMDELRRRYASRKRLVSLSNEYLPALVADSNDPAARDQALDELRAALAQLPPIYAQVIICHYVLGYPLKELTGLIGKSYEAVKKLLWRARRALLQALQLPTSRKRGQNRDKPDK
ncbi:MAG TPA: RNA polymerase sigma factor [Ktedonobacterales bacterium]|jgi:RNA polymerase sigma-70 factor (ECF subfamily)